MAGAGAAAVRPDGCGGGVTGASGVCRATGPGGGAQPRDLVLGPAAQAPARLVVSAHEPRNPHQSPGTLTCPNGQISTKFYRSQADDGYNYRLSAEQCQGCPRWQRCRGENQPPAVAPSNPPALAANTSLRKLPKPTAYRQACIERSRSVFISHYRDQQRTAILYTKTAEFKCDRQLRAQIERIIAGLVRYNGARLAIGYGLVNADYQVRMAALAFNLKAWPKLTIAKEKPVKRSKPPPHAT